MPLIDLEQLLAPISEQEPVGEDARYEFCYEMMESEVKKFGSLFGDTVDWGSVKNYSIEVLEHHSKDLKAICYLIRALVEEKSLDGLVEGLTLLNKSLVKYGTDLFPKRKRGRDGAIEWLNNQFKLVSSTLLEQPPTWEIVSKCTDLVVEVQRQFDDVFHDSEADFFEVRNQLNLLMQNAATEEPCISVLDETVNEQVTSVVETQPIVKQVQDAVIESTLAKKRIVKKTEVKKTEVKKSETKEVEIDTDFSSPTASKRSLKKVAEVMIYSDPSDPLPYRIYRHLTWNDIDGLPDHQNNETLLSLAVSSDKQSEYREKSITGSDVETVKHLERTLTDAPFWLTGHYFVHSMLNHLGWKDAAFAVEHEVKRFVKKFEGIENLSFKNSIQFADEATLQWLSTGCNESSNNQTIVKTVVSSDDDLLQMGDVTLETLGENIAELSRKLELDNSGRGQFRLYLQLVRAYHCVGLFPLCLPYLENCWEIQKDFDLASWEPHLSLQLDDLIRNTFKELYENKSDLPDKYKEWETLNEK